MRKDEVDRGVLLVYKTRNTGYFNFRHSIFDIKEMPVEARKEYVHLLRTLASDVESSYNGN